MILGRPRYWFGRQSFRFSADVRRKVRPCPPRPGYFGWIENTKLVVKVTTSDMLFLAARFLNRKGVGKKTWPKSFDESLVCH